MSNTRPTSVVIIDTETTGLWPNKGDRVLEVAAVDVDLEALEVRSTWSALCEEGAHDQGEYHRNAGTFQGVDWSGARPRAEVLRALFSRMENQIVCGQNVPFDLGFLRNESKLHEVPWPKFNRRTLDTVSLGFPLVWLGLVPDLKLESMRKWAGCPGQQSHRALGDALDTARLLIKLLRVSREGIAVLDQQTLAGEDMFA